MAGWADLVRKMVGVADTLTATLQDTVTHYAWSGATVDSYNKVTAWGIGVTRNAIVEPTSRLIRRDDGSLVQAVYKITFPRPVAVDSRDRIVISNGTEGPILDVSGIVDPDTNALYAVEVILGSSRQ